MPIYLLSRHEKDSVRARIRSSWLPNTLWPRISCNREESRKQGCKGTMWQQVFPSDQTVPAKPRSLCDAVCMGPSCFKGVQWSLVYEKNLSGSSSSYMICMSQPVADKIPSSVLQWVLGALAKAPNPCRYARTSKSHLLFLNSKESVRQLCLQRQAWSPSSSKPHQNKQTSSRR